MGGKVAMNSKSGGQVGRTHRQGKLSRRDWLLISRQIQVALLTSLPILFSVSSLAADSLQEAKQPLEYAGMPTRDASELPSEQSASLVALGKELFFDRALSSNRLISCGSCHQPEKHFSDGLKVSIGVGKKVGTRNAPSLLNVASNTSQFWDGRVNTLEQQALLPFVNPKEMGLRDEMHLLKLVRGQHKYIAAFVLAYGLNNPVQWQSMHIAKAIAAYERTLTSSNTDVDHYLDGDLNSLSQAAQRGYQLFTGTAACTTCHEIGEHRQFTDNKFHVLAVGLDKIVDHLGPLATDIDAQRRSGKTADELILSRTEFAELGRFAVTLDPSDIGKFRTPSLRNVAGTAPYMHDGSVATLEEAVDLEVYYRSSERGRPLILTPAERRDLIALLEALTDRRIPKAKQK